MYLEHPETIVHPQPFASLGHTHGQGRLVTGWTVTGSMSWGLLSAADPRKPQEFRPVLQEDILQPGQILATRWRQAGQGQA